ncbi:MAG: alpha/beta fold hydrolase [Bacteroidales bacterium]
MDKILEKKTILINTKPLTYTDSGKGLVVVLLHGYLESLDIWTEFAHDLSKFCRVICFDIPGHGKSEFLAEKQTMEQIANQIKSALETLNINKCVLVGHSMGGYLTLMFHHLFPEMLTGFCLFHSHPFNDSAEKQKNRIREIELIRDGKKNLIASVNIPNTYANENVATFNDYIEKTKTIVGQTPDDGIIANIYAMMSRPDLSESLADSIIPFLYIAGKKDNLIDFKNTVPKIKLPLNSQLVVLENSGHMGFIEEKENSFNHIKNFLSKINY